jgi:hypothetical protein
MAMTPDIHRADGTSLNQSWRAAAVGRTGFGVDVGRVTVQIVGAAA